jgi:hypothetical protein
MQRLVLWGMIAVLGLPVIVTAEDQRVPPEAGKNTVETQAPATNPVFDILLLDDAASNETLEVIRAWEHKDGKYWLGLSCAPVDETLRAQLGLEAGGGLVVRQVVEDGPAEKAGFQVHDIITQVTIGETTHKPTDIAQLTALVQQAETKPTTFLVLRGGKPLNVTVTPMERKTVENSFKSGLSGYDSTLLYMQTPGQPNPFLFRMTGPVVALGGPLPGATNLPDDLTVVITKSGSQPVEIKIQQKDRGEWRMREKETTSQPQHVSQAVMGTLSYLSRLVSRMGIDSGQPTLTLEPGPQTNIHVAPPTAMMQRPGPMVVGPGPGVISLTSPPPPTLFSLQQRLDQIQSQQQQVTKALDELRQALQKGQPQN